MANAQGEQLNNLRASVSVEGVTLSWERNEVEVLNHVEVELLEESTQNRTILPNMEIYGNQCLITPNHLKIRVYYYACVKLVGGEVWSEPSNVFVYPPEKGGRSPDRVSPVRSGERSEVGTVCQYCQYIENVGDDNLCTQCNQVIQFFNLDGRAPAGQGDDVDQLAAGIGNMGLNGATWNDAMKKQLTSELLNDMKNIKTKLQEHYILGTDDQETVEAKLDKKIELYKDWIEKLRPLKSEPISEKKSREYVALIKAINSKAKITKLYLSKKISEDKEKVFKKLEYENLFCKTFKLKIEQGNLTDEEKKKMMPKPIIDNIFNSFRNILLSNVKVVIVGMDPSKTPGLHTGVAFSQDKAMSYDDNHNLFLSNYLIIKALQYETNVYDTEDQFWESMDADKNRFIAYEKFKDENEQDLYDNFSSFKNECDNYMQNNFETYETSGISGNIEEWASHGVLLLNLRLTADSKMDGLMDSYANFCRLVIKIILTKNENCVFCTFGTEAQKVVEPAVKVKKENYLKFTHPASYFFDFKKHKYNTKSFKTFFEEKHFYKINEKLKTNKQNPIVWSNLWRA